MVFIFGVEVLIWFRYGFYFSYRGFLLLVLFEKPMFLFLRFFENLWFLFFAVRFCLGYGMVFIFGVEVSVWLWYGYAEVMVWLLKKAPYFLKRGASLHHISNQSNYAIFYILYAFLSCWV